jgi:hypothetical protein
MLRFDALGPAAGARGGALFFELPQYVLHQPTPP